MACMRLWPKIPRLDCLGLIEASDQGRQRKQFAGVLIPRLDCLGLIEAFILCGQSRGTLSWHRFRGLIASASLKQGCQRTRLVPRVKYEIPRLDCLGLIEAREVSGLCVRDSTTGFRGLIASASLKHYG